MPRHSHITKDGPVITVSRETGCFGNSFVMELASYLNKNHGGHRHKNPWKWVNKEIIYETANELKVHPNRVQKLFKGEPRQIMDEVVESLATRYYKNDRMITRAIREIVKKISEQGYVIILGRGGVGLIRHIKNTIHIRLHAPVEWRIENIRNKMEMTAEEAKSFVHKKDHQREALIRKFSPGRYGDELFDLSFNCQTIKRAEIFDSIKAILKARNLMD